MLKSMVCIILLVFTQFSYAEKYLQSVAYTDSVYDGPTVEDQVALMDKDSNGFADLYEIRAYLAAQYGQDYQKKILDRWQATAFGSSCSTSLSDELAFD